jgi:soluble lytic murein transglycosylase-like protein
LEVFLKIIPFSFFISVQLFAYNIPYTIKNYVDKNYKILKISPDILFAIMKTESNFHQNLILINTYAQYTFLISKFLKKHGIVFKKHFVYIAIYPSKENLKNIFDFVEYLKKNRFIKTYDIGLMQINYSNTRSKKERWRLLSDFKYNIEIGSKILYSCFQKFKYFKNSPKYLIECYNKGFNYEKYDFSYFNRFINNYYALR